MRTVTTFAALSKLLLAKCDRGALFGVVGVTDARARRMTARAEEADRAFAHPGAAKQDAQRLFWQVAPDAFAEAGRLSARDLDPGATTDALVSQIRSGPLGSDFRRTPLAEPYFRVIAAALMSELRGENGRRRGSPPAA